jgi:hypothetical protein
MSDDPTRTCARCRRVDHFDDVDDWIEDSSEGWICPNCFTQPDLQFADEAVAEQLRDFEEDDV